jgi:hypothetical protein
VRDYLQRHRRSSDWGKWMLAKRGGYARQRQCRALGIDPTAQATAARMARRAVPVLSHTLAQASMAIDQSSSSYRLQTAADVTYRESRVRR